MIRDHESLTTAAAKATPPIAATGMQMMGYGLADWVLLATLIYTLLQIAILVHGWFKRRNRKESSK